MKTPERGRPRIAMGLSKSDFEYVRQYVRQRAAIVLADDKMYLADARLHSLAQRRGDDSVTDLVARLRSGVEFDLGRQVIEAMATHETTFFRDGQPFETLRKLVLPELISRRRETRTLSIWSCACSTGQEPYSVAMLLHRNFPELQGWKVTILATDLSTEILDRAKRGVYSAMEVGRGLSSSYRDCYFSPRPDGWEVRPVIRSLVEFRTLNLIEPWPAMPLMDVVMMRNVLIYFETETKKQLLEKVRRQTRPDGYLFLGTAETTLSLHSGYERVAVEQSSCYQLKRDASLPGPG